MGTDIVIIILIIIFLILAGAISMALHNAYNENELDDDDEEEDASVDYVDFTYMLRKLGVRYEYEHWFYNDPPNDLTSVSVIIDEDNIDTVGGTFCANFDKNGEFVSFSLME